MKKILYISNQSYFHGGAPLSLYELLKYLDREKIQPFFASCHDGKLAAKIKELNIPFLHLPQKNLYTPPLFANSSIIPMSRFIKENHIQLIHNNQCDDALYSFLPAKLTRTPIIIHHRDPSFFKRHRFLMHHVDANIAVSTWQNQTNLSNKGIVIHNGIDLQNFSSVTTEFPELLGPFTGEIKVGLLGRIAHGKGQDVFLKAAAIVLQKFKDVQFYIVGDDNDPSSINYIMFCKSLANELNISDKVTFTGAINESWRVLPELTISVVPSRKETFGRVTIESMACYKPVVATKNGGALDIVTTETGILIPPNDPLSLSEAIIELINSPEKRKSMGQAGRKRVEDHFTIDSMLNKIYTLYDEVLVGKARH